MTRWLALIWLLLLTGVAQAGQGPQNVAVVINQRSVASQAVGQQYARLRNIPSSNLVYLDWDGSPVGTDVETFRERILKPILKTLEERQVARHISTIAYSADFPYVIDFQADIKADSQIDGLAKRFPQGSLTGLTYLGALVLAKDVRYAQLGTNFYFRPSVADKLLLPTRGFQPQLFWTPQGETHETNGLRYLMSTMLAYTSGRGNSLVEVDHYFQQSVLADGTYPAGTVYFLKNGDVRAKTREPNFQAAIERLTDFGVQAEILEGVLPKDKAQVMGAMLGTVDYRFADSGSRLRGGAIVENLTSFGGIMRENGGQTALSECLRAGAAGSSGTVTEPFAIQAKFPHPMIHVHYASGCSLAESFYQAVQGPYQLLVVGDPLARPWATIPTLDVTGVPANRVVNGTLKLTPSATLVDGKSIQGYELYVDGRLGTKSPAGQTLDVDTRGWADGWHELRVVGYDDTLIETQDDWVVQVRSENHGWTPPTFARVGNDPLTLDGNVTFSADAPGALAMVLYHNQRILGTLTSDSGQWTLPGGLFGLGRSQVQLLVLRGPANPVNTYIGEPLTIEIGLNARRFTPVKPSGNVVAGLQLQRADQPTVVVEKLGGDWLAKHALKAGGALEVTGLVQVDTPGVYQFQAEFSGELALSLDGESVLNAVQRTSGWRYVAVELPVGMHELVVRAKLSENPKLNLFFGHQGTSEVTGERFKHVE